MDYIIYRSKQNGLLYSFNNSTQESLPLEIYPDGVFKIRCFPGEVVKIIRNDTEYNNIIPVTSEDCPTFKFISQSQSPILAGGGKGGGLSRSAIIQLIQQFSGGGLPPSFQATATADDTTTSLVDVVAAGMTLTPPAGTYLVWFSGSTEKDDQSNAYESIYFNNIKVDSSEVRSGFNLGGVTPIPFTSIAKVTVDGTQTIEGRWRVDGGTGTMHQRNLTALQVA